MVADAFGQGCGPGLLTAEHVERGEQVAELPEGDELLNLGSGSTGAAGGERGDACDAAPDGLGDLRHVGGGLGVDLQHHEVAVRDQRGVRRAHGMQYVRRDLRLGLGGALLQGVDDLLVAPIERRDEERDLGGEKLEDIRGGDLRVFGYGCDRCAGVAGLCEHRNSARDDRLAARIRSGELCLPSCHVSDCTLTRDIRTTRLVEAVP